MSTSDSVTPRLYADALGASRGEHRASMDGFFPGTLRVCEITVDFLICTVSMALAFWLQRSLGLGGRLSAHMREDAAVCVSVALLTVFLLYRDEAYHSGGSLLQIRETERALRASVQSVLVLSAFAFFLGLQSDMGVLLMALVLVPTLLVAGKHAFTVSALDLHRKNQGKNHAVIYGVGDTATRVLSALSRARGLSLYPVLVIDDDRLQEGESISQIGYRRGRFVPARRGPVTAALLESCQCNTLVVALPNPASDRVDAAIEAAKKAGANVALLYGMEPGRQPWKKTIDMDGLSLALLSETCESRCYAAAKRALDLVGSSLLLSFLSPLLVLIALLVKLDSPGPAIFSQERVGNRGEHFRMYKFRSMYTSALNYNFSPITPDDPRITRIGRLLRRTSLDELPQLANVVLGHMSLVGPRPEMPFITHGYTAEQQQRLQVIPGITGLWQLSAARAFPIHENIQYDFYYIRNRSFFMDIAILVHTLFFALRGGI